MRVLQTFITVPFPQYTQKSLTMSPLPTHLILRSLAVIERRKARHLGERSEEAIREQHKEQPQEQLGHQRETVRTAPEQRGRCI